MPRVGQDLLQNIPDMLDNASVGARRDYPDMRRVCHLLQALEQRRLELRLQTEVGNPAVDGDDELGQLKLPVALQQLDDVLGVGVERQPDIVGLRSVNARTLELQGAEGVGRQ